MKKILILLLFFLASIEIDAQVYVNPGVDTTDKDIKEAIEFYTSYVNEFKGKQLPDFNKYWSAEDCKKYKVPDPSVYGVNGDISTYSMTSSKTIYYVKPLSSGLILLKSMGGWIDSLKNINVMYDVNIYITKSANQNYQFISPLNYFKENWQKQKVRNVEFIFQKNHVFDRKKADTLIKKIQKLEIEWNLNPIEVEYLFTNTYEEIQLIRGFNYSIGLGNRDKTSGISNDVDNIIYSAGAGENHFHEFVHVYLNKLFPKSPLKEGLAVFYGFIR